MKYFFTSLFEKRERAYKISDVLIMPFRFTTVSMLYVQITALSDYISALVTRGRAALKKRNGNFQFLRIFFFFCRNFGVRRSYIFFLGDKPFKFFIHEIYTARAARGFEERAVTRI